ncbi:Homoserine kinase [BD1-7 clade bacterium]|uniref:Homoserine kinase n=1 Tax=BD1-7 clade bacterium TaxID=2029982 RepID=A0A5S9MVB1_9GAMM|nr:Homoserine kinase [BD1-7 clade bacterium]CAA0083676.1 Homoserine kinase [BD1-7 clade bacterium]
MAVYTTLERDEIEQFISRYGIGDVVDFSGVSAGMENSNYVITTSSNHLAQEVGHNRQGEYFLTIFEELPENDLPFHLALLELLDRKQIPVSAPIRDYDGAAIQHIQGKPAVLCPRLHGEHMMTPSAQQCAVIGDMLARIHAVSMDMEYEHGGIRDANWLRQTVVDASPMLSDTDQSLCLEVLNSYLAVVDDPDLTKSIIHGDLFRDNALFEGEQLGGIIDFFNAGQGHCIYDLAVTVNDWCMRDEHLDADCFNALIQAYTNAHPLTESDRHHWPIIVKTCAMRFWLSRTLARARAKENLHHELHYFKDPEQFRRILHNYLEDGVPPLPDSATPQAN